MHHLFLSGFSDSDIRFCVLSSLDERFDAHLAQAENLSALFVALNDEVDWKYCLHQRFFHEDYFSVFYLGFVFSQAQKQHNCFVLLSINRSLRFVSLQFVLLADLAVWIQHTSCHHWGKRLFRYTSYYVIMYSYGQFSKLTVYSISLDQRSLFNIGIFEFFFWILNDQEHFLHVYDPASAIHVLFFFTCNFFLQDAPFTIEHSLVGCQFDWRFICC